jgi:hypothetical protein
MIVSSEEEKGPMSQQQQFGAVQADPEETGRQSSQLLTFHPVADSTGCGFQAVLMKNAADMDITVNQGREERIQINNEMIMAVMKRFDDLSPALNMQTLAKLLIDN